MCTYYHTIAAASQGAYKEKGSKFLGYAFPVKDEEEAMERLLEVKKEHPKARHHCYAFRIGDEAGLYRANDDGEPSGTAGKPILGQLVSRDVTDVIVIVVRYFGGTKLGVSGLINAYRTAAGDALAHAQITRHLVGDIYSFACDYALSAAIIDTARQFSFETAGQDFGQKVTSRFLVPRFDAEKRILGFLKKMTNLDFEEIDAYAEWIAVKKGP